MKKLAAFLLVLIPSLAFAMPSDVTPDAWYYNAVSSFANAGYLHDGVPFRPGDAATRAEFIELVVRALGGVIHAPPSQSSFDDVKKDNPSFQYFEEAAASGWMKGAGACLGKHPCYAKPNSSINRAEAASILLQAFNLLYTTGELPTFSDNPEGQWYSTGIRIAASHCLLKGDGAAKKVRPEQNMNRAEMVVMLKRLDDKLTYPNCDAAGTAPAQKSTGKTTTAPHLTQDPLLSTLTSRVTQMSTIETKLYDAAVAYKGSSLQTNLFTLANQYTGLLTEIKGFLSTAKTRPLTKEEWDRVNTIQDDAAALGDRFTKVQDAVLQGGSTSSRSQSDVDALRGMVDRANIAFKKYADARSLLDATNAARMSTQLTAYNDVITQYEHFLDIALDRHLTADEDKKIEQLQSQELAILDTINGILEDARMSGSASTYTPSNSYSNQQYCEDVKNSLGISGGWRSSQKVKEAGRKLLDAGCISSAVACSDYQVCQ